VDGLFLLSVVGAGGLNAAAHFASAKALKLEDASLVTPLLTFSPVFTLSIAALFLREMPSPRGIVGVGLVVIGAYWLNHSGANWRAPFKSLTLKPGVVHVLLAGLFWAITPLLEKTAIHHTAPESPRFVALVVTTLLVLTLTPVVAVWGRQAVGKLSLHRREWLLAACIAGGAPVLGYTAFSLGLVGYVTALFRLSAVMTVLWASLLLQERHLANRLPGSLIMAVGAILIAA
jgi:uncharacterized membrane protein